MKRNYWPLIHFLLYVTFGFLFFYFDDKYIKNDNLNFITIGLFFAITGIWGNIAKMVLLKIPFGPRSYKIINYLMITVGCICVLYGMIKYLKLL